MQTQENKETLFYDNNVKRSSIYRIEMCNCANKYVEICSLYFRKIVNIPLHNHIHKRTEAFIKFSIKNRLEYRRHLQVKLIHYIRQPQHWSTIQIIESFKQCRILNTTTGESCFGQCLLSVYGIFAYLQQHSTLQLLSFVLVK